MKDRSRKIIILISFALLFFSFMNNYLSFKLWDFDFWWHLATGRYIVENKALPETDPFSFAYNLEENKPGISPIGQKFNLQQYWLSQVLFYKIYMSFGDKGIILLRSLILLMTVFFIAWWLWKQKVGFFVIFPLIYFVHLSSIGFVGERPVLFTILFTPIIFFILDDFKRRGSRLIFLLAPLMLIWANLHGGFMLGDIIILVVITGEGLNFLIKRETADKKRLATLFIIGLVAIGASAVNPNGLKAFLTLTPQYKMMQVGTHEYYSPFELSRLKVSSLNMGYLALLSIFPIVAVLRNRKMDIVYYMLAGGLLYASTSATRYEIFYCCISAMILGRELQYVFEDIYKKHAVIRMKLELVAAALILISSVLYAGGVLDFTEVSFGKAETFSVPQDAADFVKSNNIKGNLYNDVGVGGFLIWEFYPWKKVFVDSRSLNTIIMAEQGWIFSATESLHNRTLPRGKKPLWERLLDHYKVDLIVMNTADAFGQVSPLIFSLVKSEKWAPVYNDIISIVFVRDNQENRDIISKHRLPAEAVYDMLLVRFTQYAAMNTESPYFMLSVGDVFYSMEKYGDALKAYQYADKRLPDKAFIKAKIASSENHLEEEKRESRKKGT